MKMDENEQNFFVEFCISLFNIYDFKKELIITYCQNIHYIILPHKSIKKERKKNQNLKKKKEQFYIKLNQIKYKSKTFIKLFKSNIIFFFKASKLLSLKVQLFTSTDLILAVVNSKYFLNLPLLLKSEIETMVANKSWRTHDHIFNLLDHLKDLTRKSLPTEVMCQSC
jgi:hypothetical protein